VKSQADTIGERILMAKEKVALQRSSRSTEKCRGVAPTRGPLVTGESSKEEGTAEDYPLDDAELGRRDQTTSQAEIQCLRVLSLSGGAGWREAQKRDLCLHRVSNGEPVWAVR
jgi:hypothetical protein